MAKQDEISSTEKLLSLIRDKSALDPPSSKKLASQPNPRLDSQRTRRTLPFGKRAVVGVEIGYSQLKLAKAYHYSEKKIELSDYISVPLKASISVDSHAFTEFLRSTLAEFCGRPDKVDLWCGISSARVETRCIRIPKLPKKQIPNAVYWTFTKEITFDRDTEVLDFEILEDIVEQGVQKTEVMTYTAPNKEIELLKATFQGAGYPLYGISIVPFAVQNLLRSKILKTDGKDICNLFIGRDWSRIAIYSNENLILSRGIKSGMSSMIEGIAMAISQKELDPVIFSETALDAGHTPMTPHDDPDQELAQKIFFSFLNNKGAAFESADVKKRNEETVYRMILPSLERLIRQIERTFEHYAQHFNSEGPGRIFISGPVTTNTGITAFIGNQLGLPIEVMDPFPADSTFTKHVAIPKTVSQREAYVPAIGMGLSNNTITPNFLFTYDKKNKLAEIERANRSVFMICMAILLVLTGIYIWQDSRLSEKEFQVAELQNQLEAYSPPADRNLILKFFAHSKQESDKIKAVSKKYRALALINEINGLTPANIRLLRLIGDLGNGQRDTPRVKLDGIVFGNRSNFEDTLTRYMLQLKDSELYSKPTITKKTFEFYENQEVLRFTATLDPA